MTQEEKAKAYDNVTNKLRYFIAIGVDPLITRADVQDFFPELKESDDEKIRKSLMKFLKKFPYEKLENDGVSVIEALGWLEKQESLKNIIDRYKDSWYNEGKIAGMAEGLTDDEKYQQGWHDALEKQGKWEPVNNVEPKFHKGDVMRTLQETADGVNGGLPVVISIDEEYYHCTNELIAIKDQDDYEYPPMNRRQKPKFKVGD